MRKTSQIECGSERWAKSSDGRTPFQERRARVSALARERSRCQLLMIGVGW
jgi:hypothetical protein